MLNARIQRVTDKFTGPRRWFSGLRCEGATSSRPLAAAISIKALCSSPDNP
jgi:hypothetical protein